MIVPGPAKGELETTTMWVPAAGSTDRVPRLLLGVNGASAGVRSSTEYAELDAPMPSASPAVPG